MRKPSILMVCQVIPPAYGGAGSQAMALAVALVARGVFVHLVGAMSSNAKRRETIQGVIVRRLGNPLPGRLGRYTFYMSLLGYVFLRRYKYDVIHVHGVFWPATICALVAKLTGAPLIVKMTRMGDDDVTTLENLRRESIHGALRAWPLLIAGRLVALNSKMLGDCKLSRPELRCELLPNGIDTDFWRPPKYVERKSAREKYALSGLVILYTGGLLKHKGLSFLLKALSQSGRNVTLFVVGPHDSSNNEVESVLASELDSWTTSNKDLCRVIRLGLVDRDQMRELYWASDVYVHPSQREGNPNSLVEAMACSVGSIATKIQGIIDTGVPENCYLGVESDNVQALKEAIDILAEDKKYRITLGNAAARYIVTERSIGQLAVCYENIYREELERGPGC